MLFDQLEAQPADPLLSLIGVVLHAIVQAVQRRVIFWMNVSADRPVSL